MSAKEMLYKLGYIEDEEPKFSSLKSYTKYCKDGCCRLNDLSFYQNGFDIDECFISYELLQAINKQVEELWGDDLLKNNGNQ